MKSVYLVLATLLVCLGSVVAQTGSTKLLPAPLSAPKYGPSAKATSAVGSRLTDDVTLVSNAVFYEQQDSSHLSYLGAHGFNSATGYWQYDNAQTWNYNTTNSLYENDYKTAAVYDANDDLGSIVSQKWNLVSSIWENNSTNIFTYDANHHLLTETIQVWNSSTNAWDNVYKRIYSYDANGYKATYTFLMWDGTSWANNYQQLYTNDTSGNVTQEIDQSWVSATNSWKNTKKYINSYTANGGISLALSFSWDNTNSVWDSSGKDTYTYNASNNLITELDEYWNSSIMGWENSTKIRYSNFTGSYPQTIIKQQWNGTSFDNDERRLLTYNSYGQVLTKYYESWNVGGFWQATTSDYGYRYYYEEYATDVKNITSQGGDAMLYPVPAADKLNIDLNWKEPQPFTISVMDIQGRVNRQWQVASSTTYHTEISVSELPFGTYFIRIDGTNGHIFKQLIVSPK